MSAASSSTTSIITPQLRQSAFDVRNPDLDASSAASDQGLNLPFAPKPSIARHYTSLQEHTDAVGSEPITPGGGESTPRVTDRREGFTWEVRKDADSHSSPYFHHPLTPETPPSTEDIMRATFREREVRGRVPSIISTDSFPSLDSTKRSSTGLSSNSPVSRSDTNRASISGVARGVIRHIPNLRTVLPMERQSEGEGDTSIRKGRSGSRFGRQLKSDIPQTSADKGLEKAPKPANLPPEKSTSTHIGTLKDRRKVAQGEFMKLTLPPNIPELPSRGRTPVAELSSLGPSRPRSPKTPWIRDHPPNWRTSGLASAPATILEDGDGEPPVPAGSTVPIIPSRTPPIEKSGNRTRNRRSFSRLRLGRIASAERTSESSSRSPDGNLPVIEQFSEPTQIRQVEQGQLAHQTQTQEELKEVGKRSRNRRLRWSSPWSSIDSAQPTDPPSPGRSPFSLTRILKPRRSSLNVDSTSKQLATEKALRNRKKYADREKFANMAVPPVFIPPGTHRVPTPPMLDANGEVKGKLADFFFNIEGVRTQKPPRTPGGVWDSDAVLMSQITTVSQPSSESDESPQGPLAVEDPAPAIAVTTPSDTYFNVPVITPASSPLLATDAFGNEAWLRMPKDSPRRDSAQSALRAAEGQAKLEWLTPEHLPNSPLCPLQLKYVGPSMDVCVFHGRKQSYSGGGPGHRGHHRRESNLSHQSGPLDGSGEEFGWRQEWGFST